MKTSARLTLHAGSSPELGGPLAPPDGCASCPTLKTCVPGHFNERETKQFEHMVTGRRRIARHASLYRQHEHLGAMYLVRFGQFKMIGGELDEQRVLGFFMPGDLLGLDAIATGRHQFRMMALENSEVCEVPFAALIQAMSGEPGLQRQFLQMMSASLVNEFSRSLWLSTRSLDQRFAHFLLQLSKRYARLGYSSKSFRLAMSRADIGSYLGATVESISRLIGRFNAHGAVSIRARMVDLRDPCRLDALAAGSEPAFGCAGWTDNAGQEPTVPLTSPA